MSTNLTYMANAAAKTENADLFASLGIDWKMLVLQAVAFLILLWVLNKYVFPVLMKTIDEREKKIEESQKAAAQASKDAQKAQAEMQAMLKDARKEADGIVATAKEQANKMASDADKKAKDRAEQIVKTAHDDIAKEVANAKKTLHNETIELVALATEKVTNKKVSASVDDSLISEALKEAK